MLIFILDYGNIVTIDWTILHNFFETNEGTNSTTMINLFFAWIKNNVVLFLSSVIGFIFGCLVG